MEKGDYERTTETKLCSVHEVADIVADELVNSQYSFLVRTGKWKAGIRDQSYDVSADDDDDYDEDDDDDGDEYQDDVSISGDEGESSDDELNGEPAGAEVDANGVPVGAPTAAEEGELGEPAATAGRDKASTWFVSITFCEESCLLRTGACLTHPHAA